MLGSLEKEARELQTLRPMKDPLQLVVLLGGGVESRFDGYRDLPDLNDAGDRIWVASRLVKTNLASKVLVSGGLISGDSRAETESASMRLLLEELGVSPEAIIEENRSRSTLENAWYARQLLDAEGLPLRVGLVTSAFHMPRAVVLFERSGLQVTPFLADIRIVPERKLTWQLLPKASALERSTIALKERFGLLQIYVKQWFIP